MNIIVSLELNSACTKLAVCFQMKGKRLSLLFLSAICVVMIISTMSKVISLLGIIRYDVVRRRRKVVD